MNYCSLVISCTLLLAANAITAGSAPAQLQCVSRSKQHPSVTLNGTIPSLEEELDLVLADGSVELRMTDGSSNAASAIVADHAIEDFGKRVFTLVIDRKDGKSLILYAIPATVKIKRGQHSLHATFSAMLEIAPIPGYSGPDDFKAYYHQLPLSCVYDFHI